MKAFTYTEPGRFELIEKPKPGVLGPKDAVVKVTLSSICSSDLHILHGAVPQAVIGITVGHELVGVVESVGSEVTKVKPGDVLRRMLLLQTGLRKQLHLRRMDVRMSYRRRSGGICTCTIRR